MTAPDKLQRWLDLIAYLAGRRLPVSVDELMERLPAYSADWETRDDTARASVRRKFERDKDELRDLGIPIETVTYGPFADEHGYRLERRDFYLPYLKLVREAGAGAEDLPGGLDERDEVRERADAVPMEAAPASFAREGGPRPRQAGAGAVDLGPREAGTALDALRRAAALPAFPLRREAESAFRKLAFDLDPDRFRKTPVLYAADEAEEARREELRTLSEAVLARKRVRFTYHGLYRDETTERDVAPYGLVFHGGHWYLVGHDALRDDVRVFRLRRLTDLSPNRSAPHTPDYEVPAGFRLRDHVGGRAWELGDDGADVLEARVRFHFPTSLWAQRNGLGEFESAEEGGAQVRAFEVRQTDPFLRWLLSLPGRAELLGPPELAEALRERARAVLARYEDS